MNLWDQILARIETKVNRHSFYMWFRPTAFVAENQTAVTVRVPNLLFRDWLTKHYAGVIAEAMACAVPCAVTNVGDAPLIVGDAGRVVPSRDPLALSDAMGALIAMSAAKWTALGQKARDRVLAQFTLQNTVSAYEALYHEFGGKRTLPDRS